MIPVYSGFGLLTIPVYSEVLFIWESCLFKSPVYLRFGLFRIWFINNSCLFRIWIIQEPCLFRIPVYLRFGLFRFPVYSGFGIHRFLPSQMSYGDHSFASGSGCCRCNILTTFILSDRYRMALKYSLTCDIG
jgi:hypothetical protein